MGTETAPPLPLFDAAVVIQTMLRPSLARAVESVFAQAFPGQVQLLVGVDRAQGDRGLLDDLARNAPARMRMTVFDPGYSTSVRHGGLYPNYFGGALRTILSYAAHSPLVAYLDDDNWWDPSHLSALAGAIDGHAWAWSGRWFVEPESEGDQAIAIDDRESVGPNAGVYAEAFGGFVDPSSLMIDKRLCDDILPLWSGAAFKDGSGEDRLIFEALRQRPGRGTGGATSYYRMHPSDAMHAERLQHFRDRGILLPETARRNVVPLDQAMAALGLAGAEALVARATGADEFTTALVAGLRPREILSFAQSGTAAQPGYAACRRACLAQGFDPIVAETEAALRLAQHSDDRPVAVDLLHLAAADSGWAETCLSQTWPLLRAGGMALIEWDSFLTPLDPGSALGAMLASFAAAAGAPILPAEIAGRPIWVLQKP